jgi:hypothetical protein
MIHNQSAWMCAAEHENDTSYAFSSKGELLHHISVQHDNDTDVASKSDPEKSGYLTQSMRQAHVCPLCLFSIEGIPLKDQDAANDAGNEDTVASWAMGSHIANHLHHLMIVSLQIMSAMQCSQDDGESCNSSQWSGSTMAVSADGEAVKKRLEDLPESVQGSLDWSQSHGDDTSIANLFADSQYSGEPQPSNHNRLRLLSLDGGGVRGFSILYILKLLMDELNSFNQQNGLPRAKPYEVFDLIGGSGTGG